MKIRGLGIGDWGLEMRNWDGESGTERINTVNSERTNH